MQTIRQISSLVDGIQRLQKGELDAMRRPVDARELPEVTQIRTALIAMMTELKVPQVEPAEEDS